MRLPPLNEAQLQAVEHVSGPLLVLAGAGSGKTRVLTARIARLIDQHGVAPHRILAVTFTNKAAGEMKSRVATLLGREPDGLWIGTFHSVCVRLLRREAPLIGFTRQFTIYDEDDSESLVRRVVDDLGLPARLYSARAVRHEISRAKNAMTSPEEYEAAATDPWHRNIARVWAECARALRRANAMDFDDLLLWPLRLFEEHPGRLAEYRSRFQFILVDEYQDTNRAQYLLLKHLAGEGGNLFVVGDDDQSIYGWRGADLRNILEFQRDFPGAGLVRLEENYRSTRAILEAANAVIAANTGRIGKTLRTQRPGGELLTIVHAADERDEAEYLVRELVELARRGEYSFEEFAILVRTNAQTRAFEDELRRRGVPYRIVGATGFYERREVKDLLAYLRLMVNPDDDEAFRRAVAVPRRGIGESSMVALAQAATNWGWSLARAAAVASRIGELKPRAKEALEHFASDLAAFAAELSQLQPAEALRGIVARLHYDRYLLEEDETGPERVENVNELIAAAADWSEEYGAATEDGESPIERFVSQAVLATTADRERGASGLTLMTLHAAKGLEFPVVVVAGLEEGLFPLSRADTAEAVEEERRLCYVGMTRAKDRLYLSHAAARRRGGSLMPSYPSRFLADVPPALALEKETRPAWGITRERARRPLGRPAPRSGLALVAAADAEGGDGFADEVSDEAPRYVRGERVKHRRFGTGTIRMVEGRGRDLKVSVEFDDAAVGTKQLLAVYAGLERAWEEQGG
ncbi:MAG TPA: UvrD-helicase domain-containing protein [Gemmatimonadales bacterium]|nr:UvrD-helicase domain-containing protein [Gemmatimonadales bacterium]